MFWFLGVCLLVWGVFCLFHWLFFLFVGWMGWLVGWSFPLDCYLEREKMGNLLLTQILGGEWNSKVERIQEGNIMTRVSISNLFVLDCYPLFLAFFSWLIEQHQCSSEGSLQKALLKGWGLLHVFETHCKEKLLVFARSDSNFSFWAVISLHSWC